MLELKGAYLLVQTKRLRSDRKDLRDHQVPFSRKKSNLKAKDSSEVLNIPRILEVRV